ncbi:DUF262 domain-containing protein [Flavobacterium sp. RSB2_4_14]|uniref:DUF262 domain-containing protein n=1 Tax=Flavobacterium sp. RSB2_4_14 TaxID=3447665 RepID=UPI003F320C85
MKTKRNIATYLGEHSNKTFVIPAYQRGFKWGVKDKQGDSAATVLLQDIEKARKAEKEEYFIQGVTVYEEGTNVILIDGQQRTTFFFILLSILLDADEKEKYLYYDSKLKIRYDIRESSHEFLNQICQNKDDLKPTSQDTFYFLSVKNQLIQILEKIEDKGNLKEYVLSKVKLFYIVVAKDQATKLFSMMNGAKAFMKTDELIKADFLSKASKIDYNHIESPKTVKDTLEILKDQIGEDWKSNALRSQFARQWDKWLYWWNQEEVKLFFRSSNNPMGLLLEFFYENNLALLSKEEKNKYTKNYSNKKEDIPVMLKQFQNLLIRNKTEAKENFERLRKIQKQFEDLYSIPFVYNYLGLCLETSKNKEEQKKIIIYFLEHYKDFNQIKKYSLLQIFNLQKKSEIEIKDRLNEIFLSIASKDIYNDPDEDGNKEHAFKLMLKLNIEAANNKNTKFQFFVFTKGELRSIYDFRSLEHIWPKSKVVKKNVDGMFYSTESNKQIQQDQLSKYLDDDKLREENLSAHHIGNLVLLHKHDNSTFTDKLPEDKKKLYFDLDQELKSRNLLHTMSVFAYDNWNQENAIVTIKSNQKKVLELIKKGYEVYVN